MSCVICGRGWAGYGHGCQGCLRSYCYSHASDMNELFGGEFIIDNSTGSDTIRPKECIHCCSDETFVKHLPATYTWQIGLQRMYFIALKKLNLTHENFITDLQSDYNPDIKRDNDTMQETDLISSSNTVKRSKLTI